jgi:glycosyltransferase involved in cell wall biosynthesis
MQIGGVNISRCHSDFLVERFRSSGGFDLSFHGRVHDEMRELLDSVTGRIDVSSAMVEPGQVPAIVSKCSVGFIGNRQGHEQFRLLRKSCGQLVEYLRCGKPVISMGPNDLGPFLEAKGVGFHVADAAQFDAALASIHTDYADYSRRALRLFQDGYDLAAYAPGLGDFLAETAQTRPLARHAGRRGWAQREARDVATASGPR